VDRLDDHVGWDVRSQLRWPWRTQELRKRHGDVAEILESAAHLQAPFPESYDRSGLSWVASDDIRQGIDQVVEFHFI
jgi:hypothetical protein